MVLVQFSSNRPEYDAKTKQWVVVVTTELWSLNESGDGRVVDVRVERKQLFPNVNKKP